MKRAFLPLLVFITLAAFLAVGLGLNPRHVPSPLIGRPAAAFSLPQLHDATRRISTQDMQGKVWILNVWASWCAACRDEHPALLDLAQSGRVPIIGLNYKDQRDAGIAWLAQDGDPYLASGFDHDGRVGMDYGVIGVPETYVIDQRGIIRFKHTGPLTPAIIQKNLMPLVEQLHGA